MTTEDLLTGRASPEPPPFDAAAAHRLFFETTPQGILFQDAAGAILTANPAAERILGLSVAQMQGRTSVDPGWRAVHADGSAFPGQAHPSMVALRTGKGVHGVVMGVFNPTFQATRWMEVSAVPLFQDPTASPHQVLVTFTDITDHRAQEQAALAREARVDAERRQTENLIRLSEADLRRAQRIAHVGNWTWRIQENRLEWSDEMFAIFGLERATFMGDLTAVVQAAVHPEDRALVEAANLKVVLERVMVPLEYRILWPDGSVRHVWAEPGELFLGLDGQPMALSGIVQDITDRKLAEAERQNLKDQLLQSQKMESLGVLAGGVAHDMNNVLGAILALASMNLRTLAADDPHHQTFDIISEAAQRGGAMVKSLLKFARQSPLEEQAVDLNGILLEEVRLLERTTLAKIRLTLDLAPGLPLIRGDASALAHAFMNLGVNAVDALPENGTLTLRTRSLESGEVAVLVEDDGCGMPQAVLERAMDPFFTTKEVGKGTGLGLSMVYSTVKAHGGRIELHSEEGKGTRVCLTFPAGLDPAPTQAPPASRETERPDRSLAVLLVDDDELVLRSTTMLIGTLGHRVSTASSGEALLARLEAGDQPDVVILDMNMPGMGGAKALERLRLLRPGLPVLFATGRADESALKIVAQHPGVTLLAKPYGLADVQALLRELGGTIAGQA